MEWKPYLNDRLIANLSDDFFIIKPAKIEVQQPVFCPVCEAIMKSIYDDESWKKFECCDKCASKWVYPDIERWKNGWRPLKNCQ